MRGGVWARGHLRCGKRARPVSCAGPPVPISPSPAARHLHDGNMRAWTIIQKSTFPTDLQPARPGPGTRVPGNRARAAAVAGISARQHARHPHCRREIPRGPPLRKPAEVSSPASDWPAGSGGGASGAQFRAPEPARRIASRARSGRHGEEWLWRANPAKAAVWAWV